MSNVKLVRFEVGTLSPTNQFYANGRQQIRVNITIQKQKRASENAKWISEALSPTELASLTLVDISTDPNATSLPLGWSVDTEPNDFFTGPFDPYRAGQEHETARGVKVEAPQPSAAAPERRPGGTPSCRPKRTAATSAPPGSAPVS